MRITAKEMDVDIDQMLEDVEERIENYFLTYQVNDDEMLIFEAILWRAIKTMIGFARIEKDLAIDRVARGLDGKNSQEINDDVNYILDGLSKKIESYFKDKCLDDDEELVFEALISEKINQLIVDAMVRKRAVET